MRCDAMRWDFEEMGEREINGLRREDGDGREDGDDDYGGDGCRR